MRVSMEAEPVHTAMMHRFFAVWRWIAFLRKEVKLMYILLTILALLIGVYGVVRCVRGDWLIGIILIIVALLVGPAGISIL